MTVDRFSEPAGFQWGFFTNADGAQVRTGYVAPDGVAKGTVVLLTGFRECTEKYFEVIRDFISRGYAVATLDWSGQGGSGRLLKAEPQKAHGQPYEHHLRDLEQFLATVPKLGPMIMAGHSMGAHLGLRYMADHPGAFDRAVLSSPMLDIQTGAMPKNFARNVAKMAESSGAGAKYIPGGADWNAHKEVFQDNPRTSDPVRFANIHDIYAQKPDLKIGDPTYAWIYHTFQSIDILSDPVTLKKIVTPILMEVSRNDTIVERAAQDRAAPLMGNCRVVEIPDARHEIWMERDELRQLWLAEIDRFLAPPATPRATQDIAPPKI